ncbi:unnamed protein product, partial [Ilex paraguariensis]
SSLVLFWEVESVGSGDPGPVLFVRAMKINSAPKPMKVNNHTKKLSTTSNPSMVSSFILASAMESRDLENIKN